MTRLGNLLNRHSDLNKEFHEKALHIPINSANWGRVVAKKARETYQRLLRGVVLSLISPGSASGILMNAQTHPNVNAGEPGV